MEVTTFPLIFGTFNSLSTTALRPVNLPPLRWKCEATIFSPLFLGPHGQDMGEEERGGEGGRGEDAVNAAPLKPLKKRRR